MFKVPVDLIQTAWDHGASKLSEAAKRSQECDPTDLLTMLKSGELDLIGLESPEAWAAVKVVITPKYRALWIYAIWARGAVNTDTFQAIRDFAQANDCTRIQGACDGVIKRLWERMGFTVAYTCMEIEV